MVFPTSGQLHKSKPHVDDDPAVIDPTVLFEDPNAKAAASQPCVTQPSAPMPVWGIWSSGLGVAVISAFMFPFLGVPAALVAIFAYVDLKCDDWEGYKRKRKLARRLGIIALVLGIILTGLMVGCKIKRMKHHWRMRIDDGGVPTDHVFDKHRGHRNPHDGEVMAGPYCLRPRADCYGNDIRHLKANLNGCKIACDSDSSCLSIQHNGDSCWLKRHACDVNELTLNDQGNDYVKVRGGEPDCMKTINDYNEMRGQNFCERKNAQCDMINGYCRRSHTDCKGNDLKYLKGDLWQCLRACNAEAACVSVQAHEFNCWLKNKVCGVDKLVMNPPKYDYVKGGNNGSCDGL